MYFIKIFAITLKYIISVYRIENQRSNLLLKTNLTAVPLDQCNSSLLEYNPNNRALRNGVILGQICAKDSTGTNDACQVKFKLM